MSWTVGAFGSALALAVNSDRVIKDVKENYVLIVWPFFPRKYPGTDINRPKECRAGTHIIGPLSDISETLYLGTWVNISKTFELTIQNATIFINIAFSLKIDPNRIYLFLFQGDTDEKRKEKIVKQITEYINGVIERKLRHLTVEGVLNSDHEPLIESAVEEIQDNIETEFADKYGVDVEKIVVGNIEFSEDIKAAIRLETENDKLLGGIEKGKNAGLSAEKAANILLTLSGQTESQTIHGLENLRGSFIYGGGIGSSGGRRPKKPGNKQNQKSQSSKKGGSI